MKVLFGIVVAVAFVGAGWYMLTGKSAEAPAAPAVSGGPVAVTPDPAGKRSYVMEEVATHKDASGCLTVIRGTVYDVTAWIDKHPGGDKNILKLCGLDGTAAFERKHGGQEKPENALKGFEVGMLTR